MSAKQKTFDDESIKQRLTWRYYRIRFPKPYLFEFTLKEFERDREGNWIDEIPDGNDHSIDAVRYAMMDDVLRG